MFVAVDLPGEIRKRLEQMGGSIKKARPVPSGQLHLTLKFIGEVETGRAGDIVESLGEIREKNFGMRLQGVGTFPLRGTPRVVWAGCETNRHNTELIRLKNRIETVLEPLGIERERRKFAPHITLARLRNSPARDIRDFLTTNWQLKTPWFTVDRFTLYSSRLTARGAIHEVEAHYPLNPDSPQ